MKPIIKSYGLNHFFQYKLLIYNKYILSAYLNVYIEHFYILVFDIGYYLLSLF